MVSDDPTGDEQNDLVGTGTDELANGSSADSTPVKAEETTSKTFDIRVNIEQTTSSYANLLFVIEDNIP